MLRGLRRKPSEPLRDLECPHRPPAHLQDDAKDARWFDVSALPQLAFDHKLVVRSSLRHLAKQPAAQAIGEWPQRWAAANR